MLSGISLNLQALNAMVAEGNRLLQETQTTDDWQQLIVWESEYHKRLEMLLDHTWDASEVSAVRIVLQELLHINERAVATIQSRQEGLLASYQKSRLGTKAVTAYSHTLSAI